MMLFLGAGASKSFGIKTMKEMSREFENKVKGLSADERDLYQSIRNNLGTNNLEDILTVLNDLSGEIVRNISVKYLLSIIYRLPSNIKDIMELSLNHQKNIANVNNLKSFLSSIEEPCRGVKNIIEPSRLESFFNAYTFFGMDGKVSTAIKFGRANLAGELKSKIIRFIKENCIIKEYKRKNIAKIYDKLFKIIGTHCSPPIDIFTTNYDLVVEEYFKTLSFHYSCIGVSHAPLPDEVWRFYYGGFHEGIYYPEGYDETTEFDEIFVKNKKNEVLIRKDDSDESILRNDGYIAPLFRLFKLHGSIDQYYQNGDIVKKDILFPTKTIDGVELVESMIYPMREKEVYKDPFFEALARLKTSLLSKKICVVIGYSFGDEHIQNIFIDAVKRNPEIKILLGDKKLDEVMKKLEPIKDNIIPIEGEFGKETFFGRLEEETEKCKNNS